MKALTICQPYAHLIALPESDFRHKRVENRTWPTHYRGRLLIHAGRSRDWMTVNEAEQIEDDYEIPLKDMAFGAFVARARLADCVRYEDGHARRRYPWLAMHQHASGPWCWILADIERLEHPVPWRGAQGLWEIDDADLERALREAAAASWKPPLERGLFGDDR